MITIELKKDEVYLLRACIINFISELGMELQDDHRDMRLQSRHKSACQLKLKVEEAIKGARDRSYVDIPDQDGAIVRVWNNP